MKVGDAVVFTDPDGIEHGALLANVFDNGGEVADPTVNVVYVSGDSSKSDNYGRQIERASSVVHHSRSTVLGYTWKRVSE